MKERLKNIYTLIKDIYIAYQLVDKRYYRKTYPETRSFILPPAVHFCLYGWKQLKNPNAWFNTKNYFRSRPDVQQFGMNPLSHYYYEKRVKHKQSVRKISRDNNAQGKPNGNAIKKAAVFDKNYYAQYGNYKGSAYKHYINFGEKEGHSPNEYFDPAFYLSAYADVRISKKNAFEHFRKFGQFDGLTPFSFYEKSGRIKHGKPLLFVGHDAQRAGSEIVLLDIVKWFFSHTFRPIYVLLLNGGPLITDYCQFANVYTLSSELVDEKEALEKFIAPDFDFIYLNTVVSARFLNIIKQLDIDISAPVISHIHEMELVLKQYPDELKLLKGSTKHWISASPTITSTLAQKFEIDPDNISTIHAFISPVIESATAEVNTHRIKARKSLGLKKDTFVVLGCGTVYWRKGVDLFLETAKKTRQNGLNVDFVWIGNGPDLDKHKNALSPAEKQYIHLVGDLPDASSFIVAADLFFLSSREDPFPLVVLEAAQFGIPALCFKGTSGIVDFIKSDAGITVDAFNVESAAATIAGLLKKPGSLREMGEHARKRLFSLYTSSKQCLSIYNAVRKCMNYKSSVSVVVPFYNHEQYVAERLQSILNQSIKDIQIILLDDASTDQTREIIGRFSEDGRITTYFNRENSGSPFKQWGLGISHSESEIVWIAEGDDSCRPDFLEKLFPKFQDPLVVIAAAKTAVINEDSIEMSNALDAYLQDAHPTKFGDSYVQDGVAEIEENLAAVCTLVNASALLMRKKSLSEILDHAAKFRMCGDWLVYLHLLKKGKIAYRHDAINYFRRHSTSAVSGIEGTDTYFRERYAITEFVAKHYPISKSTLQKAFNTVDHEWDRFAHIPKDGQLSDFYNKKLLIALQEKTKEEKMTGRHIGFYVHGMMFSKGGIERVVADLANELVSNGAKVTIFCRISSSNTPVYPLLESVHTCAVFNEEMQEASIETLRQEIIKAKIDVFIPMLSEWLFEPVMAACLGSGIPIIASEHNDPWKIEQKWWGHKERVQWFSKADKIHLLLNKFQDSLPESLHSKVEIIPNGVMIPENTNTDKENLIIGVGRLAEQKRFDRLIEAVSKIKPFPDNWRVEIYGDGQLYQELHDQIQRLKLSNVITLKGNVENLYDTYEQASIFVMSSEFEGFGIALVEAMSHGVVPVGYAHCNGPNEIIQDNENGFLVNDEAYLSERLQLLMKDPDRLQKLSKASRIRARVYDIEGFYKKWINVIRNTLQKPAEIEK